MKKFGKLMGAFFALILSLSSAMALDFNQNITAIYGSGNPNTGWTVGSANDITLALRAKNREDANTLNINGVYNEPLGYQLPANTRARWNWEFSISTQAGLVLDYDYFVAIDLDPSGCVGYVTVEALTYWNDSSYGDSSTLNGQGQEGPASSFPDATVVQQSQNLRFVGGDPNLDATYNYVLYAVAKGAGPDSVRLAETSIVVVVGAGGTPCPDTDGDGMTDDVDECINSDLRPFVDVNGPPQGKDKGGVTTIPNIVLDNGCSIQDLVNHIAATSVDNGDYKKMLRELAKQLEEDGILTKKQERDLLKKARIF
jgi:hypothetical protein